MTHTDYADLESRLHRLVAGAVEALSGDAGAIAFRDARTGRLVYQATVGLTPDQREAVRPSLEQFASQSLPRATGMPAAASRLGTGRDRDEPSEPQWHVELPQPTDLPGQRQRRPALRYVIVLPLVVDGETLGFVFVFRSRERPDFTPAERRILAAFAEQIATAAQNLQLLFELAEEKKRLEAVIENSADGIMTVDRDRHIIGFNASLERLTGWGRAEVLQRYCGDVLGARDAQGRDQCSTSCPLLRLFETDEPRLAVDETIHTRDGQPVAVLATYSVIRAPSGEPVGGIVSFRDIGRQKELEELRSTFLSVVSHELQTPIAIIKGYAGTLARADAEWDPDVLRQGLQTIEEESDRLGRLVNNLLSISRIEAGGLAMRAAPVDMGSLVRRVARKLAGRSGKHTITVDFPEDLPPVTGDPERLEEVLLNLVDNAVKYSPRGGDVHVSGRIELGELVVRVRDQGIGISARDRQHVFERFYRVDSRLSRRTQGTGLGLFICRAIVAAHGGRIWVESDLGHGSTFTFSLPLEEKTFLPVVSFAGKPAEAAPDAAEARPE